MAYPLAALPWIEPADRARLHALGLRTSRQFLKAAARLEQRLGLERRTGISAERLLAWTHRCDLLRLTGLGPTYTQWLAAIGVRRMGDLAAWRDFARLARRLARHGAPPGCAAAPPGTAQVARWVAQARRVVPCVEEAPPTQPWGWAAARR